MTYYTSDIISDVQSHGYQDLTASQLLPYINDAQQEFCALEMWKFLEKNASQSVTAGTQTLVMPTDFSAAMTVIDTTNGVALTPTRWDTLNKKYPDSLTATGQPLYYFFLAGQIYLYPTPSANVTIQLTYLCNPPILTNGAQEQPLVPQQHIRIITLGTLIRAATSEGDTEMVAVFQNQYDRKVAAIRNDLWTMQVDRPDVIVDVFSFEDTDEVWGY